MRIIADSKQYHRYITQLNPKSYFFNYLMSSADQIKNQTKLLIDNLPTNIK